MSTMQVVKLQPKHAQAVTPRVNRLLRSRSRLQPKHAQAVTFER